MGKTLKLKEIVVIAMISALLSVIFTMLDSIYQPLTAMLGQLGGDLIGGIYFLSALIPIFIVRKPGTALMGSLFTGVMNLLLGSPYGIHIIVASTLQGIGVEAVIAIGKYKKYSFVNMALAATLATILVTMRDYFIFGFGLNADIIYLRIAARIVSAMILGGVFSVILGNTLKATGVLNGFNIENKKSIDKV